jgi:predicted metalloprotease with PDZ domain
MRARTMIGVSAGVLGLAALVTLVSMPPVAAAGAPDQQTVIKADPQKRDVVIRRQAAPNVVVRQGAAPAIEVFPDGGARLGVQIRDLAKDDVAKLKLASQNGVAVVDVTKDSAAERAGVKANDVIVQFDGENVRSAQQLTRLVRETAPGRTVKLAVVRDGKRVELDVTPAAPVAAMDVLIDRDQVRADVEREMQALRDRLPEYRSERRLPAPERSTPLPPGTTQRYQWSLPPGTADTWRWFGDEFPGAIDRLLSPGRARLGVRVQELTPELATYFGVTDGVLVSGVDTGTPAAKAGLRAGDVVTAIDGQAVTSAAQLVERLRDKDGEVAIGVTRDKKALTLKATLDPPQTPPRRRVIIAGRPA